MVTLDTFKNTKSMAVQGTCKKIRGWYFESDEHCVPGDCNPDLVILFEDGTKRKAKELPDPENCE